MTLEAFYTALSSLNIPAVYGAYKDNQAAPYIAYQAYRRNCIHADGIVVYGEDWIDLRLVTKGRDLEKEALFEQLMTDSGISFDDPDYEFDEKQKVHITSYSFMLQVGSDAAPCVSIIESSAEVEEESTLALTTEYIYPPDANILWTSSEPDTATVSDGVVTGVSAGICIIYASIIIDGEPYTDSCAVTVTAKPEPDEP